MRYLAGIAVMVPLILRVGLQAHHPNGLIGQDRRGFVFTFPLDALAWIWSSPVQCAWILLCGLMASKPAMPRRNERASMRLTRARFSPVYAIGVCI